MPCPAPVRTPHWGGAGQHCSAIHHLQAAGQVLHRGRGGLQGKSTHLGDWWILEETDVLKFESKFVFAFVLLVVTITFKSCIKTWRQQGAGWTILTIHRCSEIRAWITKKLAPTFSDGVLEPVFRESQNTSEPKISLLRWSKSSWARSLHRCHYYHHYHSPDLEDLLPMHYYFHPDFLGTQLRIKNSSYIECKFLTCKL